MGIFSAIMRRTDGWSNVLTGLGIEGVDHTLETRARRGKVNEADLEVMYEWDPLYPRMIDGVPDQATRRGLVATADKVEDFGRRLNAAMVEAQMFDAAYNGWRVDRMVGGSIALFGANDGLDLAEPLDYGRIESLDSITIYSRKEVEVLIDPEDSTATYLRPTAYKINGSQIVHASRCHRFSAIMTTPKQDKSRNGWGIAPAWRYATVCQEIGEAFGYSMGGLKDMSHAVVRIPGLRESLATTEGSALLSARIRTMQYIGSLFNAYLIDEGESYDRRTMSVSGASDLIVRLFDRAAAVSETPLTILFGQPPTGLSTDDKAARKSFYDSIATKQRRVLRPFYAMGCRILMAATKGPFKGQVPDQWAFEFQALEEPTEKEDAETENVRAQAASTWFELGVLSSREIRTSLRNVERARYAFDNKHDDALKDLDEAVIDRPTERDEVEPPEAPTPGQPAAGGDTPLAQTAMNGAQVASAIALAEKVAQGALPREFGVVGMEIFFNIDGQLADRLFGSIGNGFVPALPAAAPAAPSADEADEAGDEDEEA